MTASAADLPARSRLGAIFAEPEEVRVDVYQSVEYPAPIIGFNLLPDMGSRRLLLWLFVVLLLPRPVLRWALLY
jgi:hypothetical protein